MAEEQSEEKTEEPTARRLTQARERGELPRSPDFGGAMEVFVVCLLAVFIGGGIIEGFSQLLKRGLSISREDIERSDDLPSLMGEGIVEGLWAVRWILIATVVVALLAAMINGGFNFSGQAAAPKLSKLNPLTGLKRIFGAQAWMALLRNLMKFTVIAAVLGAVLWTRRHEILAMSRDALEPILAEGSSLVMESILWVTLALVAIALIDVPLQQYLFYKRLRMTKQEVRDEMKDIEGRPEVKQQIRRKRRELSRGRMLEKVKDADVVIVNPSEFAVALEYDETRSAVPVVLAKGRGEIAASIKERATSAGVPLVSAPPLARAIYFTTEVDDPIPEGLYRAVAAVLAYVFRLSAPTPGAELPDPPQPVLAPEFLFDETGRPMAEGRQ